MPKQTTDIKQFLEVVNRKDIVSLKIKKAAGVTKFKARTPKSLVTLVVANKEKADKLVKMFPPAIKPTMI